MTRVVTLGETMALARTTEIGSLRHASGLALGIGGAESNVAVGLQRLGIETSWLGRVGDDPLGERIVRELRGEGLDVRAVFDTAAATGLMIKERPSAASTAVHYYRRGSAGSRLSAADVPDGWIEEAALLHVTGITPLLSDTARSAVLAVVERARAAGVPVSFDINYRSALAAPEVAGPVLREIAERATLVFGGIEELDLLGPDATTSLLAAGAAQVIVKRGPEGAAVFTLDDTTEALGFAIEPLDTVGAGDAFVAGYLSAWLEGLPTGDALVRGNACGAMACLVPGDWEAAPTRRDLERFLAGGGDPVRR
ncbi:2-dehydro-3-deoxygluconokinase [Microbacterium sp. ru370.1]|uniref:sugar kinase n=1 Tax=unclassified Microbacterium TaxID=2609290 RepID=UPI000885BA2F|nr:MULTISPECIES: sugar kinase [unclassified Microbacterium]SDO39156.1 2-dehydro-3-deoxygluconokinase [Microbacterium sp. ru370.1]SIT79249.1 2-dehydro-3-deoxygluconokinase [Microbacterium sp. RU1D]